MDKYGKFRMIKTGGTRLEKMLLDGKINRPYLWIDTYHQRTSDISGCIRARIDANNLFYVSVPK